VLSLPLLPLSDLLILFFPEITEAPREEENDCDMIKQPAAERNQLEE
jgi:hypothetical protein